MSADGPAGDPDLRQVHAELERRLEAAEKPETAFVAERHPGWLRPLLAYQRGVDRLNQRLGELTRYLVVAVVVIGFGNACLRYAGRFMGRQLTSNLWFEIQWYLFGTIFLLSLGYAVKNEVNVRVDFWYAGRSPRTKAIVDLVGHLVALIPFSLMALYVMYRPTLASWGASPDGSFRTLRVWEIWERSPDPSGLPRAPIKTMIIVGFVLLLLQGLSEVVKLLGVIRGEAYRTAPQAPARIE